MPHTPPPHNSLPTLTPTTPAAAPETPPPPRQPPQLVVPLAVWPTPHTAHPAAGALGRVWPVPPLLAQQLVAVYTAPGGTVLAVGGSARTVAHTAVRLDRRPPARDRDRRLAAGSVDLLVITPPAIDP
jgi:hypothetical protein